MRSTAHSSVASLLLLLPILAIPLFAIFGIPDFVPVVDSAFDDVATIDPATTEDAPKFASLDEWQKDTLPPQPLLGESSIDGTSGQMRVPGFEQKRSQRFGNDSGSSPAVITPVVWQEEGASAVAVAGHRTPEPPTGASGLTWKSAVQRLQQMEIRSYRLEPGKDAGQFTFICSYTPQHNPSVSYRFEAEADEPLRAVEKVLAQIDHWMAAR
ncbi:hypothetical protein GC163_17600 [bacterium]|nr:hypothetical protein [bacterium]